MSKTQTGGEATNYISKSSTSKSSSNLYQFHINDVLLNEQEYNFKDNKVDTTKYNFITFLPKALMYQFMRPANIYFLFCAIIQCIPAISPLGPETALIPVIFVLSVSLIREAIEDYARAKLDKEQNSEPAQVYRNGSWIDCKSGDLKMGEIVEVKIDNAFPADLILIDSEIQDGICFIETGTLDGEKTLKMKSSPSQTANKFNKNKVKCNQININGDVICDHPNPELYQLNGKMHVIFEVSDNTIEKQDCNIPLDPKQLLLKGAKLRNTQWIIGIVCYTGHNCKIMKNSKEPRVKYSSVESLMNKSLLFIFIFQTILCIISAILRGVYYKKNLEDFDKIYKITKYKYGIEGFISYFTYLLLLNTMIPISLIITLEVVKLIQGGFMSCDVEGYSKLRKRWVTPNSVSLNEELGLVNYIFSDKTGTLTCNKMQFRFCVIGDVCYEFLRGLEDESSPNNVKFREEENIITFQRLEMYDSIKNQNQKICKTNYPGYKAYSTQDNNYSISLENSSQILYEFWQALALCHDCSIQKNDDGSEDYIAMSPDSIELVKSAREQGFALTESGQSSIKRIKLGDGKEEKDLERLQLIEFNSDRKRETVIIRDGDFIKLYCKGADSVIETLLSKNTRPEILAQCKNYVNKFSAQGFRTLFVAMKVLTEDEYQRFADELSKANLELEDKDKKVAAVYKTVENELFLLGTTIVEDKLQDKVPETIRDLRMAGVKIWMLTGDKMNTAYNIGLSCNLISKEMKTFEICGIEVKKDENLEIINQKEMDDIIHKFVKEYNGYKGQFDSLQKPQFGILVDEKALLTINNGDDIQRMFLEIAKDAVAVICCRVSPLQKSQVVKMMKNYEPKAVTLAIGDGGNDVSMIMEAHIGVGIYGEEGMRAVQSSDYAIGEFKFLHRIMLFHGRTNYIRNCECVMYFFYKNFVFTLVQFCYGFYNNFSGQTIMDDWFITLFNLLFTSLPLGVRAVMDFDVKPTDGEIVRKMLPFLFSETRDNPIFTTFNFGLTLLKGLIHCLINCYLVIYCLYNLSANDEGNIAGLWFNSVNLFTNILLIVSIDLIIFTRYETIFHCLILLVITFIAYIVFLIIVHNWNFFNSYATMVVAFSSGSLWINVILICVTCFIIDQSINIFNFIFLPSIATELQKIVNERGSCDNEIELPYIIKEKLKIYNQYVEPSDKTIDKDNKIINSSKEINNDELRKSNKNTNDNPNINTENSNINTENPNINTENPNINTENPNINAENPNINTENPNINTENPNVNTDQPMKTPEINHLEREKKDKDEKPIDDDNYSYADYNSSDNERKNNEEDLPKKSQIWD